MNSKFGFSSMLKWEITLMAIHANSATFYKVTRRMPELYVAETRMFSSKDEALEQFDAWLS